MAEARSPAERQTVQVLIQAADGVALHLEIIGAGEPLLLLSGGPGCVNDLAPVAQSLVGWRCFLPDPRGVGQSEGGAHDIATALRDLESLRSGLGLDRWTVLGHSWGADLGLAYALTYPEAVSHLVSFAGTGVQHDADWKAAYRAGKGLIPLAKSAWEAHTGECYDQNP